MSSNRLVFPAMFRMAALVAVIGFTQPAFAHTLSVTRGTVVIEGDVLTVQLEPTGHGESPVTRLFVRDAQGDRLVGRCVSTMSADVAIKGDTRHYRLRSDMRYVSFQLTPPGAPDAGHAANVVLTVRVNGEDRDVIRLASTGNVEAVRIAPAATVQTSIHAPACTVQCVLRRSQWFASHRGDRSVRSIVTVENWGVHIELLIPTPVIETWVPIARADRDFITPPESALALANAERFIEGRFRVRVNGADTLPPVVTATFLDLADPHATTDRTLARLSAWTSGLQCSLKFRSTQRPDRVELDWKLFNAIVLTSHALTLTPDACEEVDFSTYNPHWSWQRR